MTSISSAPWATASLAAATLERMPSAPKGNPTTVHTLTSESASRRPASDTQCGSTQTAAKCSRPPRRRAARCRAAWRWAAGGCDRWSWRVLQRAPGSLVLSCAGRADRASHAPEYIRATCPATARAPRTEAECAPAPRRPGGAGATSGRRLGRRLASQQVVDVAVVAPPVLAHLHAQRQKTRAPSTDSISWRAPLPMALTTRRPCRSGSPSAIRARRPGRPRSRPASRRALGQRLHLDGDRVRHLLAGDAQRLLADELGDDDSRGWSETSPPGK